MVPDPAAATFRTAAGGRCPYISARTGPECPLDNCPPPEVPKDWTALSVDGSHIDMDRHLPLRCHLINLGGCAITNGANPACHLFSEPVLVVADADLYLGSTPVATVFNVNRNERLLAVSYRATGSRV